MTIEVEIAGTDQIAEFPDGTPNEVIINALKQFQTQQAPTLTQPIPEQPSFTGAGVLEPLAAVVSGAIAEPLAGLAGIAQAINPFAEPGAGARAVQATTEALTFQPRTQAGRESIQAVGEFVQPVTEALTGAEEALGGATFEATGSPLLASLAQTVPTLALELLGVAGLRGGIKASDTVSDIANATPSAKQASILEAAAIKDVPVLTTDLFPPESFLGRTFQSISEKLGPLGSGSARATQQKARVAAVEGFADEFGIDLDSPFADSVVRSLNKESAKKLKQAGLIRSQAVEALDGFGDFEAPKTLTKIDELLGEQQRLGAQANSTIVNELTDFRTELSKPSDFSLKKDFRTLMIKKRMAFDRAEDTSPRDTMQAIKSALDNDMVAFARVNDKVATRKWLASNRQFAKELDITKRTEIKRILNSGDATPEKVIPILKGGKPSELNRLHNSLGEKGRAAAQQALLQQALKDARFFEVDANPNPDALATALNRPNFQQASKVFFRGKDKKKLDGFTRMLNATRRAQSGQAVVKTGEQLLAPVIATGTVAGIALDPFVGLPLVTTASALAKAYESTRFRNLMLKLSNTKPGSKQETRTLELATPLVVGELQAARREQEETQ